VKCHLGSEHSEVRRTCLGGTSVGGVRGQGPTDRMETLVRMDGAME
jgi:hypothetical protein